MAHEPRQGMGGGGCIPASLFKVFGVASGVLPPPDRRSTRELGRRREAPTHRCQCRRVPEATRSASSSSTSHRFAARPDPTRVSGRRAPDRERAARERCPSPPGPDPTPRGPDRKWSLPANDGSRIGSAGIGRASSPDRPPATTPRSSPRRFRIAAHSMTNRSSGSLICSAEWIVEAMTTSIRPGRTTSVRGNGRRGWITVGGFRRAPRDTVLPGHPAGPPAGPSGAGRRTPASRH
jgi:hypothetical protein